MQIGRLIFPFLAAVVTASSNVTDVGNKTDTCPRIVWITSMSTSFLSGCENCTEAWKGKAKKNAYRIPSWHVLAHEGGLPYETWVYHEDKWDIAHGRQSVESALDPHKKDPNLVLYDVFDTTPELVSISYNSSTSPIDAYYRTCGSKCPFIIQEGKILIRKVAAMKHAAENLPDGTLLIWADFDVEFKKKLNDTMCNFLNRNDLDAATYYRWPTRDTKTCDREFTNKSRPKGFMMPYDIVGKCRGWATETGVFFFRISPKSRAFINAWYKMYTIQLPYLMNRCRFSDGSDEVCKRSKDKIWSLNDVRLADYLLYTLDDPAYFLKDLPPEKNAWDLSRKEQGLGENVKWRMGWLTGGYKHFLKEGDGSNVFPLTLPFFIHKKGLGRMRRRQRMRYKTKALLDVEYHRALGNVTPATQHGPAAQTTTPAKRTITPAKRTITPAEQTITPAEQTTFPAKRTIAPAKKIDFNV